MTLTYRTTKTLPVHLADDPAVAAEMIRDQLEHDDLESLDHLLGSELEITGVTSVFHQPVRTQGA